MTGTGYQSDAAAMAKGVAGFEESAVAVRTAINALQEELRERLATYKGAQAQAFWQVQGQIKESMDLAGRELDTMSTLVRTSATNYSTSDEEAASDINSVDAAPSPILNRLSGN
ncbi:WXG100 family type VII secretion target [Catenuloplanes japonicus]|uniref:WXG100 family type VII secretion target n=1 Tax=Catenuloplanes japonicus TaxID=33876 RepID=UPI00069118CD|nr:WXG100 family type VII secretion target [Catenuloplanes japonicus]